MGLAGRACLPWDALPLLSGPSYSVFTSGFRFIAFHHIRYTMVIYRNSYLFSLLRNRKCTRQGALILTARAARSYSYVLLLALQHRMQESLLTPRASLHTLWSFMQPAAAHPHDRRVRKSLSLYSRSRIPDTPGRRERRSALPRSLTSP